MSIDVRIKPHTIPPGKAVRVRPQYRTADGEWMDTGDATTIRRSDTQVVNLVTHGRRLVIEEVEV